MPALARFLDHHERARRVTPPRLVVVADVAGQGHYHLGDEAMLEANLWRFRQLVPGIRFTVLSKDPIWTSTRYGVDALRRPPAQHDVTGVHTSATLRPARLEASPTLCAEWLGDEIAESLRAADGLVISGGGNLCDTWPEQIWERVALIEVARAARRPIAVLGQMLGPRLSDDQRKWLAVALCSSAWMGVRDSASAVLAQALGVPAHRIHQQLDDAFFLEAATIEDDRAERLPRSQPWIVVTLDASFGSPARAHALEAIASQLDALAVSLGAALMFAPHVGGADVPDALADLVAGRALGARLGSPLLVLDPWQPREIRWLIAQAALVVSTRYHALVFATAAGTPSLGIYSDEYTRSKLRGALTPAGLDGWCISVAEAQRLALFPLAMELWHHRLKVRRRLARLFVDTWPLELRRWDGICRALDLHPEGILAAPPQLERAAASSFAEGRCEREIDGMADLVTEEQWRRYEQQGYLRLGPVLDAVQLAALQQRMDDVMLGKVRYPGVHFQLDTGGAYEDLPEAVEGHPAATLAFRKVQGLEADPLVLDLIRRDLFREICGRHYGKHASISIFRAMLMNKPANQGTHLPWHQDAGDVWKLDRDPLVTIWIALDSATRANGCLEVIPGSHRLGLLSKNGSTISASHAERHCPDEAITYLEVEAGEALLLHNWLLHRSAVNCTDAPRRAFTTCFMDGRTMSTLTGDRFPIVFGEREDPDVVMPFLQRLKEENGRLHEMAAEAERYARSLLDDNHRREQMRADAEAYAKSLEAEVARLRDIAAASTGAS
jgi:polysaccharide pyruvyl transferase WcaK-like protein